MKGLVKAISVVISFILGLYIVLFILGLSFRAYSISDFNDIIYLLNNDLNIKFNLDFIYNNSFINYSAFIILGVFIFIGLINIINKVYDSFKYVGSIFIINSSIMLISLIFVDKIKMLFNNSIVILLNNNMDKFISKIYKNSIIFLISGLIMIVLYAIIDVLYERYKNNKIKETIEIIEER